MVDSDQKGKVSVRELRDALKAMGQRFSDASLDRMLHKLNIENSAEVRALLHLSNFMFLNTKQFCASWEKEIGLPYAVIYTV